MRKSTLWAELQGTSKKQEAIIPWSVQLSTSLYTLKVNKLPQINFDLILLSLTEHFTGCQPADCDFVPYIKTLVIIQTMTESHHHLLCFCCVLRHLTLFLKKQNMRFVYSKAPACTPFIKSTLDCVYKVEKRFCTAVLFEIFTDFVPTPERENRQIHIGNTGFACSNS